MATMVLGVVLLIVAVFLFVVAGLAWSAKLPGNNWVGIRVPEVRRDPEMWALAHRVAGPSWTVAALAMLLAGVISFTVSGWGWLWVLVAVLASVVMIGMGSAMGAHTVAVYDARRQAAQEAESSCSCGGGAAGSATACGEADCQNGTCSSCTSAAAGTGAAGVPRQAAPGAQAPAAGPSCGDPAADCGVEGGCGCCSLNGACDGGGERFDHPGSTAGLAQPPAGRPVDIEAARRAANAADS